MIYLKSFCSKSSFLGGNNTSDDAVEKATMKADSWVDELDSEWRRVEIMSMSTQLFSVGDYVMYVITVAVRCENEL